MSVGRQHAACCAALLPGRVPVAALPDLMRAAGHYPSEADKGSLLAHVRFLADMAPADDAALCSTSGGRGGSNPGSGMQQPAASGVDLDTFLLLYLSHRPVVDFDRQQVEAAFKALGATTAAGGCILGVCSCPRIRFLLVASFVQGILHLQAPLLSCPAHFMLQSPLV